MSEVCFWFMSKVFDRVWHGRLIDKIKCVEINGMLLKLMKSFLNNRFQRVVLNGPVILPNSVQCLLCNMGKNVKFRISFRLKIVFLRVSYTVAL